MNPWWLRPTAEGAEEAKNDRSPETKPEAKSEAKSADARPADESRTRRTRAGGDRQRGRSRGDGDQRDAKRDGDTREAKGDAKRAGAKPAAKSDEQGDGKPERQRRAKRDEKPAARRARTRGDKDRDQGRADQERAAKEKERADQERVAKDKERADRDRDRAERQRGERARGGPERDVGSKDGKERGNGDGPERRRDYTFDDDISQSDFAAIRREILAIPERNQAVSDERKIALFCDLENVALGVRDSEVKKFDIDMVLGRLLEKGKIIVKKAYCDWERYSEYKRAFHEAAIEMIDIPQKYYSGKNSADIKMVVDAMDLSYSKEHLDTFVILSGDSDFSPLVSKLKENNKYVIGIGVKGSSSNLLIDNCDEFIYYEDLWRERQKAPQVDGTDSKKSEAFRLMVDAIQALLRDNKDVLWGSMIKQTMQRKKPSFSESYHGYSTFSELLEDAERNSLIKLKKDQRSGTYIVTGFAKR